MNTSKRTQRPILLAIVAVLALAVLVSASVIFALATEAQQDTVYVSLDGRVNVVFKSNDFTATSYNVKVGSRVIENVATDNKSIRVALYPYEMAETIEVVETDKSISVVDYVKKILASSDSNVMDFQDSARALLNYGAMTQLAFDKDTSNLANAGIFTKGNPIDGVTSIAADPFEASGINGTINLILREGDIVLRYELTSEESFTATLNGEDIEFQSLGNNQYSFEIKNISVNDFAKKWTVVIDGATTDPVTCERTVLQYLNYNIFDATSTASDATKDACRALYQLYQQTVDAAKPDQTACQHDGGEYWVSVVSENANEQSRTTCIKCIMCAKDIDTSATTVLDGGYLAANSTFVSTTTHTVTSDNAVCITRPDYSDDVEVNDSAITYLANANDYTGRGTTTGLLNVGGSEYIVIKYKISGTANSDRFRVIISTTGASSTDPKGEKSNGYVTNATTGSTATGAYDGISAFWLDATNDWAYKVIHAPSALMTFNNTTNGVTVSQYKDDPYIYKKDTTKTDDYIIDTLYIDATDKTTSTSTLTVGYIAFAENLTDVEKLLEGDTDVTKVSVVQKAGVTLPHGFNPTVNNTIDEDVVDGKIQHTANCGGYCNVCGVAGLTAVGTHTANCGGICTVCGTTGLTAVGTHKASTSAATADSISVSGYTVYSNKCPTCGTVLSQKTLPDTGKYFGPYEISKAPDTKGSIAYDSTSDTCLYATPHTSYKMTIFVRSRYDRGYSGTGAYGNTLTARQINIGNSEYIVIRVKTKKLSIQYSTTGYNITAEQSTSLRGMSLNTNYYDITNNKFQVISAYVDESNPGAASYQGFATIDGETYGTSTSKVFGFVHNGTQYYFTDTNNKYSTTPPIITHIGANRNTYASATPINDTSDTDATWQTVKIKLADLKVDSNSVHVKVEGSYVVDWLYFETAESTDMFDYIAFVETEAQADALIAADNTAQ